MLMSPILDDWMTPKNRIKNKGQLNISSRARIKRPRPAFGVGSAAGIKTRFQTCIFLRQVNKLKKVKNEEGSKSNSVN